MSLLLFGCGVGNVTIKESLLVSVNTLGAEFLPIKHATPNYPRALAESGIEGYCIIQYVVTSEGKTRDHEVSQCIHLKFVKPSIETAKKFEYSPIMRNGDAVNVDGVRNKFSSNLNR